MVSIIYEDNHLLVVKKPINIPVQADQSLDIDLLTMLKEDLRVRYQKPGDAFLGLVHRLDRPVSGIMVFAKTSKAAARLSQQLQQDQWYKGYLAVIEGYQPPSKLEDFLLKDRKTNTTKVDASGKFSTLVIQNSYRQANLTLLDIELITGRSHQIRVQLASRNTPIWGDQRYNPNAKIGQQIALIAHRLDFNHPITKERLSFQIAPSSYPFNQFSIESFDRSTSSALPSLDDE